MYQFNKYICIGILLGIIFSICVLPRKTHHNPKIKFNLKPLFKNGMIMIPINKKQFLHLHHWFIFYLGLFFLNYKYYNNIILGFSIIMVIQGTLYNDFLKFIN